MDRSKQDLIEVWLSRKTYKNTGHLFYENLVKETHCIALQLINQLSQDRNESPDNKEKEQKIQKKWDGKQP